MPVSYLDFCVIARERSGPRSSPTACAALCAGLRERGIDLIDASSAGGVGSYPTRLQVRRSDLDFRADDGARLRREAGVSVIAVGNIVAMVLAEMTELGLFSGDGEGMRALHKQPVMIRGNVGQEGAAEGRVWTGQDAKALGLVDEFGNLDDALKAAAELANLKSWQVTPIAPEESARDKFLRELFDSSAQALAPHLQSWLPAGLGKALVEMNRSLDPLTRFNDPQGTYAFCPVCVP